MNNDQSETIGGVSDSTCDVTERKRLEEQLSVQVRRTEARNQVYKEALSCETEEQFWKTCLSVAEWLTGSKLGYIGLLYSEGLQNIVDISNPGWELCNIPSAQALEAIKNMPLRGVDRGTMLEGKSRIVNGETTIQSHKDHVVIPEEHPHYFGINQCPDLVMN